MQQGSRSLAFLSLVHLENSCKILTNVRPQENGNKSDIHWMSLTDHDGAGFIAVGMPTIDISDWLYTMTDPEKTRHIHELPQRDMISVNIDHKQVDSDGNDSWGIRT